MTSQPESNGPPDRWWVNVVDGTVSREHHGGAVLMFRVTPAREHAEEMERALEKGAAEVYAEAEDLLTSGDESRAAGLFMISGELRFALAKVRGTK